MFFCAKCCRCVVCSPCFHPAFCGLAGAWLSAVSACRGFLSLDTRLTLGRIGMAGAVSRRFMRPRPAWASPSFQPLCCRHSRMCIHRFCKDFSWRAPALSAILTCIVTAWFTDTFQYMPFRPAKQPVLEAETHLFAVRYGSFCRAERLPSPATCRCCKYYLPRSVLRVVCRGGLYCYLSLPLSRLPICHCLLPCFGA